MVCRAGKTEKLELNRALRSDVASLAGDQAAWGGDVCSSARCLCRCSTIPVMRAAKGASRPERSRDPGDRKQIQRRGTAVAAEGGDEDAKKWLAPLLLLRNWKFADSPLERNGFEPLVPRCARTGQYQIRWA